MECAHCDELLVDAFGADLFGAPEASAGPSDELEPTDPTDLAKPTGGSEALLEASQVSADDFRAEAVTTLPRQHFEYTGDLPRLFQFGDRYQILEKLGEGGMGRVYKALDLELDRPVALKTVRMEKGGEEVLERFKQELILARKITHKNVVRIHDLGEFEGMKYFTMELVDGDNLGDILKERKRIPVDETVSYMGQILSGLAEAHSQGVVHRDLKPQNIMVDDSDSVRIMDFGIARTADSATMTATSEMMGTPDYISPEQVKGETADSQSDLYSFGVILYELLTGETPFKGDTPISKIVARVQTKPKPPRELNPDIPKYLERIILKCLEVDPELRYESAEAIMEDLESEQVDRSFWLRTRKAIVRKSGWIAAAAVLTTTTLGGWYYVTQGAGAVAATDATTLAILPFHNMTGETDIEWMTSGIPEMLITDISQMKTLRPVTAERMRQVLEQIGKGGQTELDEETIKVVAELTGADHTLYGRFAHSGGEIRLDLAMRDSATGVPTHLKLQGIDSEIFALVDTVTDTVTASLDLSEKNLPLDQVSTKSVEAFRLYQEGLAELSNGANHAAVEPLQKAVDIDPGFAMAHAKLGEANFHLGDTDAALAAVEAAEARLEQAPLPLSERYEIHAIAARVRDDPQTAVDSYRALVELHPGNPQTLLSLASSLETLGELDESVRVYEELLELEPNYGAALLGLGRMLVIASRPMEAIPPLERAVAADAFDGDHEALGMLHSILGVAHRDLAQHEQAIDNLRKSLQYRREDGDARGISASLVNLSQAHLALGQASEARTLLVEALDVARLDGNATMESFALVNLGYVEQHLGGLRSALTKYRDSLEIEFERNQHSELADRLNLIGRVYSLLGNYADAMVYLKQAEVHIEISGEQDEKANNLFAVGRIQIDKGRYEEASESLMEAEYLYTESGRRDGIAKVKGAAARVLLEQGKSREAVELLRESIQLNEELRLPAAVAETKIALALALVERGELDDASIVAEEALVAVGKLESPELQAYADLATGSLHFARGEYADAAARLATRATVESSNAQLERALLLGRIAVAQGKYSAAEKHLELVREESARRRLRPLSCAASIALAELSLAQGNFARAKEMTDAATKLARGFGGNRLLARVENVTASLKSQYRTSED